MPEGHTVHRIANRFNKDFAGKKLRVISPQGRFTDAQLVSGKKLIDAEAHGKQLFLRFGSEIVRIHLGIYGKWSFAKFNKTPPDPVGQVRARFQIIGLLADLRGPTACEVIDRDGYAAALSKLGPDPLKKEVGSDSLDKFLTRISTSSRSIAELLMDQSVIAGVGNVYRAELLFRARLSPFVAGKSVPKEILESLWEDAMRLMPIGVRTGLMLTREGFLSGKPSIEDRYYVYKREGESCRECGGKVSIQLLAGRKLYWCRRCQK